MQFGIPFLIAVLAASAIHMALVRTHPVWSLSLATLVMLVFTLGRQLRRDNAGDGRLILVGIAASFAWMMMFGGSTFAVGYAYTAATDAWPDPDEIYIDTPTAVIIFVLMYGGAAAIAGCLAGSIATLGFFLNRRYRKLNDGG